MPYNLLLIPTGKSEILWDVPNPNFVMRLDTDGTWPTSRSSDWGSLVWRIGESLTNRAAVTIAIGMVDPTKRDEWDAIDALKAAVAEEYGSAGITWEQRFMTVDRGRPVALGGVAPGIEFHFVGRPNTVYRVLRDQSSLNGNVIRIAQNGCRTARTVMRTTQVVLVEPASLLKA